MNAPFAAAHYRQSSALGAHPVGWVVRLYDVIIEDFREASAALREGRIERRTAALNHALLVIAELEGVLDHERGGQVARHLQGLYRVSRALILEANARASSAQIEKLIGLFLPVRHAWQQVEREQEGAGAGTSARQPGKSAEIADPGRSRSGWNV
jgi:flagellar protein FliS